MSGLTGYTAGREGTAIRRRVTRLLAASLAVAVSVGALAACGSDDKASRTADPATGTATTAAERSQASTPPAVGPLDTVTWNLSLGEPLGIDFFTDTSGSIMGNTCEGMQRRNIETGELEPALAASTEYPDDTTIVYNLREGVKFWDGKPLTAEDVVFSFERTRAPDKGSFFQSYWKNVKSIEATGPMQVTLKFSKPDALFRELQGMLFVTGVLEKDYYERVGMKKYGTPDGLTMCTGPFKPEKWTPGQEIVLVPNEQYWDTSRVPKVKRLVFKFVTDNAAIAAGLRSGELDGTTGANATAVAALKDAPNVRTLFADGPDSRQIVPFAGGALENADLRRALSLSLDRDAMAGAVYPGYAKAMSTFYPPWTWVYGADTFRAAADALPGGKPDLEGAKAAFAKAGSPTTPVRLAISGSDQEQVRLATLIRDSASKAGINVEIVALSPTRAQNVTFSPDARKGLDALLMMNSSYYNPEPAEAASAYYFPSTSTANFLNYRNPTVDRLINEAGAAFDADKRAQLLVDAQKQFLEQDWVVIPLMNVETNAVVNKRIGGVTATPFRYFVPWAATMGAAQE